MNLTELSITDLVRRRDQAALVLNAPTTSELDKANAAEQIKLINQEVDRRRR